MRTICIGLGAVAATLALLGGEREAKACGGCFHPPPPPNENPSMVTAHRMILTVSSQQTTLYDQIKYSGSPKEFAWVLPISGVATVGLSADIVFATLGSMTEMEINAPPMNCPPMPSSCNNQYANAPGAAGDRGGSSSGGGASSAADGGPPPVTVTKEETVGPYETVQLHSTDPQALNAWLGAHGYIIPPEVQPIISAYVNEHFDFLALKLAPGAGVNAMRPVRVSTPGAAPTLPLRMVAAGTGATVGITLWVIGEGRYDPQNFPFFTITADDLAWDWKTSSSNFAQVRTDKQAASQNRAWEIETSIKLSRQALTSTITYAGYPQYDAGADYLGIDAGTGGPGESPAQVRQDDINTLFDGIPGDTVRVTRIRSDLAHAALGSDLALVASSTSQDEIPRQRQITKEANEPMCPIYQGCELVGEGTRSQAQAAAAENAAHGESFSCRASRVDGTEGTLTLAALASFVGLVVARNRRRRGV
jgi:hypothetical protein